MKKTNLFFLIMLLACAGHAQQAAFSILGNEQRCRDSVYRFQNQSTGATSYSWDFEWCSMIPELPSWILEGIKNKNEKQGFPAEEKGRVVGPGFAINTRISLERDIQLAIEATWAMPPEAADDYDIWITAGQALHSLDESLLDVWEDWSKQSDKYRRIS